MIIYKNIIEENSYAIYGNSNPKLDNNIWQEITQEQYEQEMLALKENLENTNE